MGEYQNHSALVLYGSETGNAFDFAQELGRVTERIRFWTHVSSLDAVELVCILIDFQKLCIDNP